ncbi:MAG: alpha-amylase family glycosyl hydrolase [Flavobacteriaceae bacterium]|nr:alpha-amylase family glycosyl hydrolase [Flavobacteriaceae bacterium]
MSINSSNQNGSPDLLSGVMLNAYPDSMGQNLSGLVAMLQEPGLKGIFSQLYLLPTFFNSDLDRGFSIIDYDLNKELVSVDDLEQLKQLGIHLKLDIVLNHLSVASPQFKDLLEKGGQSPYKDFFIDWNEFWVGNGDLDQRGVMIPEKHLLDRLFMRKPGLPILKVPFEGAQDRFYWNTFYQRVALKTSLIEALEEKTGVDHQSCLLLFRLIEQAITDQLDIRTLDLRGYEISHDDLTQLIKSHTSLLGQMDVNANASKVWEFYQETLNKIQGYGGKILRLDAFAYLHKAIGETNFFNKPGTWTYLDRLNKMAQKNQLWVLPEIHAEFGQHLHDQVAEQGFGIYDFFLPGLVIHTIEKSDHKPLLKWANEILKNDFKVVNMLGCHDGIPVLDLKGKQVGENYNKGLLSDAQIDDLVDLILSRGGRVKNLFGPDGSKISYYQINATYYSALGANDQKLLLARAIQLFMPGLPQVWYLDLFAGENDDQAADQAGKDGHKEINRTNLSLAEMNQRLKKKVVLDQLKMIRFRNSAPMFHGTLELPEVAENHLHMIWRKGEDYAVLEADLGTHLFTINVYENQQLKQII